MSKPLARKHTLSMGATVMWIYKICNSQSNTIQFSLDERVYHKPFYKTPGLVFFS